jgi:hypothetical protein
VQHLKIAIGAALLALAIAAAPAHAEVPPGAAFSDLEGVCARDEETLWGVSLCGPTLIADPASGTLHANRADPGGAFALAGTNVWAGPLPEGLTVANAPVEWSGLRWTMVVAPLPEAGSARRILLAHQSFRRIQDKLGIAPSDAVNAHLETADGRTWMRLEMRALTAAMEPADDAARLLAARDALAFRAARLAAFPGADAEERKSDRSEGLAEYTGVRLATADSEKYAAGRLRSAEASPSFAHAYASATGPAWGLLLDKEAGYWREARWRRTLGDRAPAEALASRLRLGREALDVRTVRYNGEAIAAEEAARIAAAAAR